MEHRDDAHCIKIGGYGVGGPAGLFGSQVHVLSMGICLLQKNTGISSDY